MLLRIEIGIAIEIEEKCHLGTKNWTCTAFRSVMWHGSTRRPSPCKGVHRLARDQWLRASQSIPLNIAEGNGKTTEADRRRYFEIARGSALECAAIQDVLVVGKALDGRESQPRKNELDRMAAMLSRLGGRGYCVKEDSVAYGYGEINPDFYSDFDSDETASQQGDALAARTSHK